MTGFGYAGKVLMVDLTTGTVGERPTSDYAARFLGGRGLAAAIHWDETPASARAFDPANCLVFATGPLMGFTRLAGCRWEVGGTAPGMDRDRFSYANFGGSWGAWLKYAGYDALAVTGRAGRPVYLLIENDRAEIRDAAFLWGRTTTETQEALKAELGKGARVLDIGPAAENLVTFANISAEDNASGTGGLGGVMGSKNLKAVVVRAAEIRRPVAADPDRLRSLTEQVCRLQTTNWEDHGHELVTTAGRTHRTACYGCIKGCTRGTYRTEDGRLFKFFCQASAVYRGPANAYRGNPPDVDKLGTRLCDEYGLDTAVLQPMIEWLESCRQAGRLDERETGLPLDRIGSPEFIEVLVKKVAFREGFGEVLAGGTLQAAARLGRGTADLIGTSIATRAGECRDHDLRLILANALIYATEPRRSVYLLHASALPLTRWLNWLGGEKDAFLSTDIFRDIAARDWGGREAADFTTYAGKALASKKIQDYGYVKASLVLCDMAWPIYYVHPQDGGIGAYTLESRLVSAITGRPMSEAELENAGERVFNLQRAILIRQGWGGRAGDVIAEPFFHEPLDGTFYDPEGVVPDGKGKLGSRKGAVIDRDSFEKLKDEYYTLRGWDAATGLQKGTRLNELGLGDIARSLRESGLLK
jgi:aldehyde:ferredoxin oxidoreductase